MSDAEQLSDEGLVRHYLRLADALRIGVVIYNNSVVSKLWMPPHLMARCAEHPNIIADKENTSDVTLYKTMRDAIDPAKMTVLCSLGDLQFAYTAALGCPGFVSMTANFAPELSLALLEAADACDFLPTVPRLVSEGGRTRQHRKAARPACGSRNASHSTEVPTDPRSAPLLGTSEHEGHRRSPPRGVS